MAMHDSVSGDGSWCVSVFLDICLVPVDEPKRLTDQGVCTNEEGSMRVPVHLSCGMPLLSFPSSGVQLWREWCHLHQHRDHGQHLPSSTPAV